MTSLNLRIPIIKGFFLLLFINEIKLILCLIISKYPFNGYNNLSVNFLCQLDVWRVHYAGVSKWAGTRYFYPLEIVYSTGRNYWTPPKLAVVKTTSTMVDRNIFHKKLMITSIAEFSHSNRTTASRPSWWDIPCFKNNFTLES